METAGKFTHVNRILHIGFILLACLQFVIYEEPSAALGSLGISLAFDPFDQQVKWSNRPVWQKAWLIVIVLFTFTGIITRFI
jgi:MFS superfamily sulfate permease-like transporter